jgi:hypothetical protein
MSAVFALRTKTPKIRCANLGPRYASPIPAPSGRPLTKGAFLQGVSEAGPGCAA